jgi:serpin B
MTMKTASLFLIGTLLLISCQRETIIQPPTDITTTEKSAKIIAADNQFGLELFSNINAAQTEQKNTMISPMSISLALAMAYNGTGGNTKAQMESMLHKSGLTPDDINQNYKELVSALASHDPKVELSISNAIFYRNTFSVKPDFIATNQNYYNAEVAGLDFSKTSESLNTVNGWINSKTKGKIDKIINQVKPEDIMYILNAIYFNGEWEYRFDAGKTSNQAFKKEDNSVIQAPTMTIENKFNYFGASDFEMLELPYGSGKFSMLILLPKSGKKVNDVISSLTVSNLNNWISGLSETNKKVYLPKFEFKFDKSLLTDLEALGMIDAFNPFKSNLSGISEVAQLYISEVMHKSYIKVDEKGTEAAAVTSITVGLTSVGPDLAIFRVDHPFVFMIREKDTNSILFIGKVIDPTKS